jgi:hypothetical protein
MRFEIGVWVTPGIKHINNSGPYPAWVLPRNSPAVAVRPDRSRPRPTQVNRACHGDVCATLTPRLTPPCPDTPVNQEMA